LAASIALWRAICRQWHNPRAALLDQPSISFSQRGVVDDRELRGSLAAFSASFDDRLDDQAGNADGRTSPHRA